jgi:hypothetical protein
MYNMKALANSSLGVLHTGRHCPFLNSKGVIIFSANSLFQLSRGKKLVSGLAKCVVRGGNYSKQPNISFTMSSAKSSKSVLCK